MKIPVLVLLAGLLGGAAAQAQDIPPADQQIAAAVLAAPEDRRGEAAVLGYDPQGELVTLREGTNELICLADDPKDKEFSVACYHKDLEPYMARGRELVAQGVEGRARNDIRWKEVEEGKLKMAREPRTLYVTNGTGFDPATGTIQNAFTRWVLYWPFATLDQTGLPAKPAPGQPWLMDPGTAGAHIMITPARPAQ